MMAVVRCIQQVKIRFAIALMIVAAVLAVVVVSSSMATAQSSTQRPASNGSGAASALKISPLRTDLVIRPGETRNMQVTVQNVTLKPLNIKPIANDFVAGDSESGVPDIILDEDKFAPTHSLKRFMQPLSTIAIGPGETKTVDAQIKVPSDAQAGGYYGALRFAPVNASGDANVNVSGSIASLILLTVPGNTVESLQLTDFDIRQNKKKVSRLSSSDNVDLLIRLENKGNVHVSPFGSISVQKSGKLVYSAKVNDVKPAGVILPDSSRQWSIPVEKLGKFGKYEVSATLGYGGGGETINVKKTIWIIPGSYIFFAVIAFVLLIVLIVGIVLGLQAYKRKILRGARRRR